jgi:cardiolipin synthase
MNFLPHFEFPHWLAPIVTVLHLSLAIGASCHIVLAKRDVRAAIGWIGLVWLSPILGTILYVLFGINRIHRKAHSLRRRQRRSSPASSPKAKEQEVARALDAEARHLGALVTYMDHLTGTPLTPGNKVELLDGGEAAFPAMIAAIDRAERSVGLASYIFNADAVGMKFVEALGRAVARGVEVRVLIDSVGARYHRPRIFEPLKAVSVPCAGFLPSFIPAFFPFFNLRLHRKILVIDGREGFTGGMNIDAEFDERVSGERARHDLHFRLVGPVVDTLRKVFADDWAFRTREVLDGPSWSAESSNEGEALARGVVDGPDESLDQLAFSYLGALNCARRSVAIVTPYFLPEPALIAALGAAAMRGVDVDIYLPAKNNLPPVQWACMAMLWQILERGCRVWAVSGTFDHAKIMLVDRSWSFFGSGNWDPRSLRLNFEFNVECYDPALAKVLEMQVESRRQRAAAITPIQLQTRSLPVKLRDGVARLFSPYM